MIRKAIGGSLFRRTMSLVLAAVLLCTMLALIIYRLAAPNIFAAGRSDDLLPKARLVAQLVESRLRREISTPTLMRWIGSNTSTWEAYVWVVDPEGQTLLRTQTTGEGNQPVGTLPRSLKNMVEQVLTGQEASHIGKLSALTAPKGKTPQRLGDALEGTLFSDLPRIAEATPTPEAEAFAQKDTSMVVVGVPIVYESEVVGAVIMGQTMSEVVAGMRSMTNALMLSLVAAVLLLLPIAYLVAYRMARPMRQMRDAALAMAGGNFSVQANPEASGEIGELGGALNFLSSELGKTVSALLVERNRLRSILNGLSEGIVAVDAEGQVTHANPAVRAIFGEAALSGAEEAGSFKLAVVPHAPVWAMYEQALLTGQPQEATFAFGEATIHLAIGLLEGEEGRTAGAVGVFRDVTQAQRLEQTRRDYVANVSHELRTPLTALRALIEPLRDGLVQDETDRERVYNVMLRETLRLSRLVSDMLELSRLQSGALSLEKYAFDPARALLEVYQKFAPHAEDHGQTLTLTLPEQPLPQVLGNVDRTEQVLVTLLDNAIKYTPEGGVIGIAAELVGDVVRVSVRDDGAGIASADLPHVFERFYKADKAHQGNGTGLGLAIAKEILGLLGEEIRVTSQEGQGSTFTFTLHVGE